MEKVVLYSRNGKINSQSYVEVARALEGLKGDGVIDGELVAIGTGWSFAFSTFAECPAS